MSLHKRMPSKLKILVGRYPVAAYFALTFMISWIGALAVASPHLIHQEPLSRTTGILMFPVMLLGPSLSGIVLTWVVDGRSGLRDLVSRMTRVQVPWRWYTALIIPPALVLAVLLSMEITVSPVYAPNFFFLGMLFGLPAGFLEEIGWIGYAFVKMRSQDNALVAAILLGLLWAIWHFPVINYLGTATPHGTYLLPFFLAFTLAMSAMRMLICWIYTNTNSIFLTQLMHVSSTGSLVVFSAPRVTAAQEVLWYALYGSALWVAVAIVAQTIDKRLKRKSA